MCVPMQDWYEIVQLEINNVDEILERIPDSQYLNQGWTREKLIVSAERAIPVFFRLPKAGTKVMILDYNNLDEASLLSGISKDDLRREMAIASRTMGKDGKGRALLRVNLGGPDE